MNNIYFDHNSTTMPLSCAIEEYNRLSQFALNNLAIHQMGRYAENIVEQSRKDIKNSLNANNFDITFTSSATEASNLAIFGSNEQNILISQIEHAAIYNCQPNNKNRTLINVNKDGIIDINHLSEILSKQPDGNFITAIMLANNETGAIQPIKEIAKLVHQHNGIILCDIVQAFGKIDIDLEDLNIDMATISAHKIGGLQGVGALLSKKNINIDPIIFGGGQENNKRAGTLNIAAISAFASACNQINHKLNNNIEQLRDYLELKITEIAKEDIIIFSKNAPRLPNTSFFATKNCPSHTQLIHLDLNNICVSSGSTCSLGVLSKSRTLQAMKVSSDFIDCAIRISLGHNNKKKEIDQFIKIWQEIYQKNN
jgi:cysteine desulfurase